MKGSYLNFLSFFKDIAADNRRHSRNLLKLSDLPSYLQFNKYIFTGYRPLLDSIGCVTSLIYFHNETINILTHAIPMIVFLFWVPNDLSWTLLPFPYSLLPWLHISATISSWIGSSIYHLFMCHISGIVTYRKLLQVDMMGIWVTQTFGALTTLSAFTHCLSNSLRYSLFVLYCVTCVWGFYKAVSAKSVWQRRLSFTSSVIFQWSILLLRLYMPYIGPVESIRSYCKKGLCAVGSSPIARRLCFVLPICIRICLMYLRTYRIGGGHPDALLHVYLQDIIALVGGAIGALRIPEKWFPGKLDYWFNSHHIMHVLVVIAVIHMHYAAKLDLEWLSKAQCK
ncbi:progestin and adipoQ receptor family member 4-like [Artemia franciscana]